jgi:hypothetical protein
MAKGNKLKPNTRTPSKDRGGVASRKSGKGGKGGGGGGG